MKKNSSVDEIGERYGEIPITTWTIPLLWNFTTRILNFPVTFAYLISTGIGTFSIIAFYKCSYLLSFLMINIYGSSMEKHVRTKILLEGLKCYKHTVLKWKVTTLQN